MWCVGDTFLGLLQFGYDKRNKEVGNTGIETYYETRVVRGDEMFRL
jgi:hypothetical protein